MQQLRGMRAARIQPFLPAWGGEGGDMVQLAGMPLSSSSSSPRSALNHTRSPRARPRHSSAASPQQLRARDAGTRAGTGSRVQPGSSPGPGRPGCCRSQGLHGDRNSGMLFFPSRFPSGSKSALQKGFVFPSTLLCLPALSQDEAIPVHTVIAPQGSGIPCPAEGGNPIHPSLPVPLP